MANKTHMAFETEPSIILEEAVSEETIVEETIPQAQEEEIVYDVVPLYFQNNYPNIRYGSRNFSFLIGESV